MMRAFGRLRPGADVKSGNVDVSVVASRLQQEYPADYPATRGFGASMDGLQNQLTQQVRPMLLVLLGTAGSGADRASRTGDGGARHTGRKP
jgi:hypothetical protein